MSLTITSSKLTGTPGEAGWCQIHEFTPEEGDKLHLRGHLIAVFATSALDAGDDQTLNEVVVGRECITRLHEEYFGNLEKSAFNALKDSLEKVFAEFKDSLGPLEIIAGAVLDDVIYTAAVYGGQVAIYRNGMFAKIIESRNDEVITASGYPQAGDILILGTSGFFKEIAYGSLKASLEKGNPEAAAEFLAPQLHASNLSGRIGAVVVKFEEKEKNLSFENVLGGTTKVKTIIPKEKFISKFRTLGNSIGPFLDKLSRHLPARKIYVKASKEETQLRSNKKVTFTVGIILLLLLLVSIGFGVKQKRGKDYRSSYEADLTKANHNYEEAISLKDVNLARSRELFLESRSIAADLTDRGIKDQRLLDLQEQIDNNQGTILGEYTIEPDLLIDLSLLTDNFSGEKITYSDGEVFILDSKSKKIVNIVIENKKSKVFAGPSKLGDVKDVASYFGRVFTLEEDGVYDIADTRKKVINKDWGNETLIYAYGSNLYVLDKSNSDILRFVGSTSGFSSKQKWLGTGVTANFTNVISWTIDGSVWLLNSGGEILRYSLGNKVGFSAKGVPFEGEAKYIYTNEETASVYLVFPEKKSVVVLAKEGDYQAEYISDKIGEAKGFIVSEKDKKIIILTGDKLYSIELKHL
jgi:hypothetical protein